MLVRSSVTLSRRTSEAALILFGEEEAVAMHDAFKVTLREVVERVLTDFRHKNVTLAPEPHLVWRRVPGGWHGEHKMRPTDSRDVDRAVDWEGQASGLDHVLQAHRCHAFRDLGTTTSGWIHCSPLQLLRCLAFEMIRRTGSTDSNPDVIDQLIQEISDFVDSTFIVAPFLVPLLNFTMDRTEAIVFDEGITLRPLADDEMTQLHGGLLTGMRSTGAFPDHGFAFSGEVKEAKETGTTCSRNPAVRDWLEAKLKLLVLGLRTFKAGPVGYDAIHFNRKGVLSWLGGGTSLGYGNEYVPGGIYKILDAEVEPLRQHMRLVTADLHPSLEAACGRLGAAQARTEPRDMLIDAVVGLEAILLAQTGDERYRGEMRFRFAMNYAVLHETPAERYTQFLIARTFYDLRSILVHGEQVEERKIGDRTMSLREAADRVCEMLRFAVGKFLLGGQRPVYMDGDYWPKRYFPHGEGSDS